MNPPNYSHFIPINNLLHGRIARGLPDPSYRASKLSKPTYTLGEDRASIKVSPGRPDSLEPKDLVGVCLALSKSFAYNLQ